MVEIQDRVLDFWNFKRQSRKVFDDVTATGVHDCLSANLRLTLKVHINCSVLKSVGGGALLREQ